MLKKILLLLASATAAYNVTAQIGYGYELGLGMSSMRFAPEIGFTKASKKPVFSGKVGGLIDASITPHFYIQTGLYASLKGQQRNFSFYSSDSLNEQVAQTLHLAYADLPVNLTLKTGTQGKGRVIMGIGCTLSYGIGGSNKLTSSGVDSGVAFNREINQSVRPKAPLKAFDIGLNLFAGYELPTGWFFRAYYTAGTNDLGLSTEIDKNRMWGIAAGKLFGKGRNINQEKEDLIDKSE